MSNEGANILAYELPLKGEQHYAIVDLTLYDSGLKQEPGALRGGTEL
jgi:hypothetical protein